MIDQFISRGTGLITIHWVILVLMSIAGALRAESLDGYLIRSIKFMADGPIHLISEGDLRQILALQEGEEFSQSKARHTILQIHATELFWDVQINPQPVGPEAVDVVINLIRRFLVREISFRGETQIDESELRRELALREGQSYSNALLEDTVTRLRALYRNHGFYRVEIQPGFDLDRINAQIDVRFDIEPGDRATVNSLEIDIDGDLTQGEALSLILVRVGGLYSRGQLDQSIQELRRHLAMAGYFNPEIYLRDGEHYNRDRNTVDLLLRIVLRESTQVTFSGLDLSDSEKRGLPIFRDFGSGRLQVRETVSALKAQLQDQGFFLATVESEISGQEFPPEEVTFLISRGRKYDLAKIRFEGNQILDQQALSQLLVSKEAGLLSRGELTDESMEADISRIRLAYEQRGFLDVRVEPGFEEEDENLTLTYRITEGAVHRVARLKIIGAQQVASDVLLRDLRLREGQPFSPLALAADRATVASIYESRGYRDIDFESSVEYREDRTVDVAYQIQEGSFYSVRDVLVAGNKRTSRSTISSEILVHPGGPLSYGQSLQSETNLYNLAVFDRVRVKELPVFDSPLQRSLLFSVSEAPKYSLSYGLGYSHTFGSPSSEGLRGTFGITDNNFLGKARKLSLGVRAGSRKQRGNLTYTLPRPFGFKLSSLLSFSVDNERRIDTDQENVITLRGRPYDSFRVIASVQSERVLSRRESIFVRYNFERIQLKVPEGLEEPLQFFREQEDLRLSALSISYLNESRENPADPSEGFFLSGDATLAAKSLGSEEQYFRILSQGRYYYPLFSDVTLVSALRIGIIAPFGSRTVDMDMPGEQRPSVSQDTSNPVPISERFFAGGPSTLRGLSLDLAGPLLKDDRGEEILVGPAGNQSPVPLGGNGLLVGNVELRFPLFGFLGGVLFYDVGNVFETLEDFGTGSFNHAVGTGLSIRTPIGPVRLDLAYDPSPQEIEGFQHWNFHFNIGHPF